MEVKEQFWISLVSGACAGTATDTAFFPIDTVKTRLQAKGGFFANGGYKGIYRGLGSAVVASAPSASIFFVTYDVNKILVKRALSSYIKNEHTLLNLTHMISASLGEICACSVRVPAEVIKQRTQALQFRSSLESLKYILAQQNVFSNLYRGWQSTIMREIPFTMIQYPLYEYMKARWSQWQEGLKTSPLQGAICGSIAGGFAAAVTTPLDVIKTRMMLHPTKIKAVQMAKSLYIEEGYKVFWNGLVPRTLWISAGGAIFLGVYELVKDSLTHPYSSEKRLE